MHETHFFFFSTPLVLVAPFLAAALAGIFSSSDETGSLTFFLDLLAALGWSALVLAILAMVGMYEKNGSVVGNSKDEMQIEVGLNVISQLKGRICRK